MSAPGRSGRAGAQRGFGFWTRTGTRRPVTRSCAPHLPSLPPSMRRPQTSVVFRYEMARWLMAVLSHCYPRPLSGSRHSPQPDRVNGPYASVVPGTPKQSGLAKPATVRSKTGHFGRKPASTTPAVVAGTGHSPARNCSERFPTTKNGENTSKKIWVLAGTGHSQSQNQPPARFAFYANKPSITIMKLTRFRGHPFV
jgi:hypothetical protein